MGTEGGRSASIRPHPQGTFLGVSGDVTGKDSGDLQFLYILRPFLIRVRIKLKDRIKCLVLSV